MADHALTRWFGSVIALFARNARPAKPSTRAYQGNSARQAPDHDRPLLWAIVILLTLGLVMVYSASVATAGGSAGANYQPTYFLMRHLIYVGLGVVSGLILFQVPLRVWQDLAPYLFVLGLLLLVIVLIPGLGRRLNGAQRWISLGFATVQPSEAMKLFAVLYAADYTVRKSAVMHSLTRGLLPMLGVMMFAGFLLLREPDFGAFVVITAIAVGILFIGGMNARWFGGLLVLLVLGFILLVATSPYRMQRIFGFMDPWSDVYHTGYQLSRSLIAIGRGEWLGVGLGASMEKQFYLPEAHNDFLLAVIAEELGLAGVVLVVGLFVFIVMRAFAIGRRAALAERPYGALVAYGVGIWLGVQAFINIGVNTGALPTKGLTLPLMSFGGSSILANCAAIAILLRVDWENRQLVRGLPA